jgi:exosortase family protein XrtM
MPHEQVRCDDRSLVSVHARLRIVRGCEGTEILLLLAAAVFAYPASLRHRTTGLLIGAGLAWLLSAARLALLFWALRQSPGHWEALHGVVAPLLPVICVGLYFLYWSSTGASSRPAPGAANAA